MNYIAEETTEWLWISQNHEIQKKVAHFVLKESNRKPWILYSVKLFFKNKDFLRQRKIRKNSLLISYPWDNSKKEFTNQKRNDNRNRIKTSESRNNVVGKIRGKTIDYAFPHKFLKLYLLLKSKIVTQSVVMLNICRNIWNNYVYKVETV